MAVHPLTDLVDFFIREMRLPVAKALDPNDPKDFIKIVNALKQATVGLVGKAEADALKAALGHLDVDWKNTSGKGIDKVVFAAKAALNPVKTVLPKIEQHFEANAQSIGMLTKGSAKANFGFDVGVDLTKTDQAVLGHIAASQGNYIKDEYGKRADAFALKAKKIIYQGIEAGHGTKDIASRLREELSAQQINRSQAYWEVVAGSFANRARTYANLATYQDALIQWFTFEAVMDERTSEVCRFMHGKRFRVEQALGHFAAVDQSDDPEEIKTRTPWLQMGRKEDGTQFIYARGADGAKKPVADVVKPGMGEVDKPGQYSNALSDKSLAARGIMMPPLHGNCRSTVLPDMSTEGMTPMKPPKAPPAAPFALTPSPGPNDVAPPPKPALNPAAYDDIQDKPDMGDQVDFQFGPGGIPLKPIELTPLPPEPGQPEPPKKLVGYAAVYAKQGPAFEALAALKAVAPDGNMIAAPLPIKPNAFFADKAAAIKQAFDNKVAQPVKKLVDNVAVPEGVQVNAAEVEKLLKDPKKILKVEVKFVKVGKDVFVIDGYEAVVAAKLLGKGKVRGLEITKDDVKKIEEEMKAAAIAAANAAKAPPKPPAPVPAPKPIAAPPPTGKPVNLPPPAGYGPPVDPANILHKKYGEAQGSNQGGFYEGADGVKRYVKFYDDTAQAHGEVLANALYAALGHAAPEAVTFQQNGKPVYAAKLLDGETLGAKGVTKDRARDFFKAFAADVLVANWDAAGQSVDNAFVLKDGRIARIDNGGCFLMRAKAGRKNPAVLNKIAEVEGFFPGSGIYNPGYHKLAEAAGYSSVNDFADDFKKQVKAIHDLKQKFGGWSNFVAQYAPGLNDADKKAVIDMLESRANLLEVKVAEIEEWEKRPKPKPGEKPSAGYRAAPINGAKPSPTLKLEDLPETPEPKKPPEGKMPWGESHADYKKRAAEDIAKASPDARRAVVGFTNGTYPEVRASEREGRPNADARAIKKAFEQVPPEPCTVFRAISVPKAVAEQMMREGGVFRLGEGNKPASSSATWSPEKGMGWAGGTSDDNYGDSVKIKFMIHQRSGIAVETVSHYGHEREILLPADAEFKVVSTARLKGRKKVIIIELEEI